MLFLAGCAAQQGADGATDAQPSDTQDAAMTDTTDANVSVDGADVTGDAMPAGPVLYAADRSLSPVTASIAANLRAIAAHGVALRENVFAKIGDSNTVATTFMRCFAGTNVDLSGRTSLQPTIDHFRAGDAAGTDPYTRTTLAAVIGWSAWSAIAGSPSPLTQETDAIHPQYGVVMYGSNDIQSRNIDRFAGNMLDIADQLIAGGTVPLFTSVPPRDDDPAADAWVPRYNAVVRGVAQTRQIPFIDLERELRMIAGHGLGPDGLHLNAYFPSAGVRACVFDATGLGYGANVRNLLTIQSLDRAHRAVSDASSTAPDATAPTLRGRGTPSDPFVIDALPFSDARNTATGGTRAIASYPGCASAANESGPEFDYVFTVARPTRVRAMVFNRGTVDTDVHLLGAAIDGASCIQRNDKVIVTDLAAGTYHFALDTYVASGVEQAGEYLFVLMEDAP